MAVGGAIEKNGGNDIRGVLMFVDDTFALASSTTGALETHIGGGDYAQPITIKCDISNDEIYAVLNVNTNDIKGLANGQDTILRKATYTHGTTTLAWTSQSLSIIGGKDNLCATFELDASYVYLFCSVTDATYDTDGDKDADPSIILLNIADFTYVKTIMFNWALDIASNPSVSRRPLITQSILADDVIYYVGITFAMFKDPASGSDFPTEKSPFISNFDTQASSLELSSGCYYVGSRITESTTIHASYISIPSAIEVDDGYRNDLAKYDAMSEQTQTSFSFTVIDNVEAG